MKRAAAAWIVRHRYVILIVMLVLAVVSAGMITKTNINYDLNRYLSDDTMTKRALSVMEEEFGSSEQLRVMFTDQDEDGMERVITELEALPEVMAVSYDAERDTRSAASVT